MKGAVFKVGTFCRAVVTGIKTYRYTCLCLGSSIAQDVSSAFPPNCASATPGPDGGPDFNPLADNKFRV